MTTISYATIISKSKIIKQNVEQKHSLIGSPYWAYYIAKSILYPNRNITQLNITGTPKNTGDNFHGSKISQPAYLDCCKRLCDFVERNKRLPYYITWNNHKISFRDYLYNFSKILLYYHDNKILPRYNTINTGIWVVNKKYGHATKSGCDNRGQNTGYYCGCHSLQEVFRNLTGIVVPQSTIASWAGTTTDGTDHDGLNTAVEIFNRKYNKKLSVKWYNFSELKWNGIRTIINSNNQDCVIHNLYRNQWGHYEVINKVYDTYCDVQNSLGDYCDNGCYCGYVEERSFNTFQSYLNGISQKSVMVITNES